MNIKFTPVSVTMCLVLGSALVYRGVAVYLELVRQLSKKESLQILEYNNIYSLYSI